MSQSLSQKSQVVEKLHQIADIIAVSDIVCARCGREIAINKVILELLEMDLEELREMKVVSGFFCCRCIAETRLPETESYAHGVANYLSITPEIVRDSEPVRSYSRAMAEFNKNKVRFYQNAINDRKRKIERYKKLISKHKIALMRAKDKREIDRRRKLIAEYERRIKKHEKAIRWLEFLINEESKKR